MRRVRICHRGAPGVGGGSVKPSAPWTERHCAEARIATRRLAIEFELAGDLARARALDRVVFVSLVWTRGWWCSALANALLGTGSSVVIIKRTLKEACDFAEGRKVREVHERGEIRFPEGGAATRGTYEEAKTAAKEWGDNVRAVRIRRTWSGRPR